MEKHEIAATIAKMGLTVESVFIPFSQSRNKAEKHPTLNWRVTVTRAGRDVLTTDYSAGMAHCPAYSRKVPAAWDRPVRMWQSIACAAECEKGKAIDVFTSWGGFYHNKDKPILPDPADVCYSLIMDSGVLNAGGFENWAADYGYDTDSRQAEATYRACLDIALKLRGAIGDSGMQELQTAFQDY